MGISKDLIVGDVGFDLDKFYCSCCHLVPVDPQFAYCQHIFCKKCLVDMPWDNDVEIMTDCPEPECGQAFDKDDFRPFKFFQNIFEKAKVRCEFDHCSKVVDYNMYSFHQENGI